MINLNLELGEMDFDQRSSYVKPKIPNVHMGWIIIIIILGWCQLAFKQMICNEYLTCNAICNSKITL